MYLRRKIAKIILKFSKQRQFVNLKKSIRFSMLWPWWSALSQGEAFSSFNPRKIQSQSETRVLIDVGHRQQIIVGIKKVCPRLKSVLFFYERNFILSEYFLFQTSIWRRVSDGKNEGYNRNFCHLFPIAMTS